MNLLINSSKKTLFKDGGSIDEEPGDVKQKNA
jgi:hypothetical protein